MRYRDTVGEFEYTFWRDEDWYLGYLNEYPEYWTQGCSKQDLVEHLSGLLWDLESEDKAARFVNNE